MSYFPVDHRATAGEIDDFDDCDPVHYAGGYDIDLTYGRSLPPSYETCYPYKSSASGHPQFASDSAYAVEAPGSRYNSYPRPAHPASVDGLVYGGPKPNYGFQPGAGVSEHGGWNEYARPDVGYGSGYSMKPSSYGRSSEYENPSSMHDKPGRKPDYGEFRYSPGVRKPVSGFGGSRLESGGPVYGGWPEQPSYPRPSYPDPNYPIPSYPEPHYPTPSYPEPHYSKPSYPEPSHPAPSYPDPSHPAPSFPEPSYPTPGYGPQKYERDVSNYEERKHHHSHDRSHHYRRQ